MSCVESWYIWIKLFLNVLNFLNLWSCAAICSRSATGLSENLALHMCFSPDVTTTVPAVFSLECRISLAKINVQSSSISPVCRRSFHWRFTRQRHVSIAKYWINPALADFLNLSFFATSVFAPPDLTVGRLLPIPQLFKKE